jgi:hypothetical protein
MNARSHGKPARQSPLDFTHSANTTPMALVMRSPATLEMIARRQG